MAGLESSTHDVDVASAVEGVVETTIAQLNKLLHDGLALELGGVDEVGGTELAAPFLLGVVDIDNDNLLGLVLDGSLDDGETDAAGTENGDGAALLDVGSDTGGSVTGGDTAAEQAGTVHRSILLDGDDGDVGNDCVLGESGGTHEVEEILSTGAETAGAIGHQTLTLGSTDLTAEVGLARLAELALLALGGAIQNKVVSILFFDSIDLSLGGKR